MKTWGLNTAIQVSIQQIFFCFRKSYINVSTLVTNQGSNSSLKEIDRDKLQFVMDSSVHFGFCCFIMFGVVELKFFDKNLYAKFLNTSFQYKICQGFILPNIHFKMYCFSGSAKTTQELSAKVFKLPSNFIHKIKIFLQWAWRILQFFL